MVMSKAKKQRLNPAAVQSAKSEEKEDLSFEIVPLSSPTPKMAKEEQKEKKEKKEKVEKRKRVAHPTKVLANAESVPMSIQPTSLQSATDTSFPAPQAPADGSLAGTECSSVPRKKIKKIIIIKKIVKKVKRRPSTPNAEPGDAKEASVKALPTNEESHVDKQPPHAEAMDVKSSTTITMRKKKPVKPKTVATGEQQTTTPNHDDVQREIGPEIYVYGCPDAISDQNIQGHYMWLGVDAIRSIQWLTEKPHAGAPAQRIAVVRFKDEVIRSKALAMQPPNFKGCSTKVTMLPRHEILAPAQGQRQPESQGAERPAKKKRL